MLLYMALLGAVLRTLRGPSGADGLGDGWLTLLAAPALLLLYLGPPMAVIFLANAGWRICAVGGLSAMLFYLAYFRVWVG